MLFSRNNPTYLCEKVCSIVANYNFVHTQIDIFSSKDLYVFNFSERERNVCRGKCYFILICKF